MVRRCETVIAVGVHFHRSVAAEQEVGEEDRHLWHEHSAPQVPGRDRQGGHQVLAAIRSQLGDRPLRTRQHDRDVDPLEQEAERRRCVRHRVRAVEHHHSGMSRRMGDDRVGNVEPVRDAHGGRVDRVAECRHGQRERQPTKERQMVSELTQVERHERAICVLDPCRRFRPCTGRAGAGPSGPDPTANLDIAHRAARGIGANSTCATTRRTRTRTRMCPSPAFRFPISSAHSRGPVAGGDPDRPTEQLGIPLGDLRDTVKANEAERRAVVLDAERDARVAGDGTPLQ